MCTFLFSFFSIQELNHVIFFFYFLRISLHRDILISALDKASFPLRLSLSPLCLLSSFCCLHGFPILLLFFSNCFVACWSRALGVRVQFPLVHFLISSDTGPGDLATPFNAKAPCPCLWSWPPNSFSSLECFMVLRHERLLTSPYKGSWVTLPYSQLWNYLTPSLLITSRLAFCFYLAPLLSQPSLIFPLLSCTYSFFCCNENLWSAVWSRD